MNHELPSPPASQDAFGESDAAIELSSAGRDRRGVMLGDLLASLHDLHRRRRARRRAAGVACLIIAGSGAALLANSILNTASHAPSNDGIVEHIPGPGVPMPPPAPHSPIAPPIMIARVTTDPAILDRYRIDPPRIVQRIRDEELLRILASMDRPAGFIRIGEEVRFTAPVTDDELHEPPARLD